MCCCVCGLIVPTLAADGRKREGETNLWEGTLGEDAVAIMLAFHIACSEAREGVFT